MNRDFRRALLRGALIACLAPLPLLARPSGVGVVLGIAVAATLLTAMQMKLDGRWRLATTALVAAGPVLYAIAGLQGVYTAGVFQTRTLDGGVQSLEDFGRLLRLETYWEATGIGILFVLCGGIAHALAVLAQAATDRRREGLLFRFVLVGGPVSGLIAGAFDAHADPSAVDGDLVLRPLVYAGGGLFVAAVFCITLSFMTIAADAIERRLWRAEPA